MRALLNICGPLTSMNPKAHAVVETMTHVRLYQGSFPRALLLSPILAWSRRLLRALRLFIPSAEGSSVLAEDSLASVPNEIVPIARCLEGPADAHSFVSLIACVLSVRTSVCIGRGDSGPDRPSARRNVTRSRPHVPTIRRDLPISRLALVVVVPRRGRRLGVPTLLSLRAWLRLIDGLPFGIPTLVNRLSP